MNKILIAPLCLALLLGTASPLLSANPAPVAADDVEKVVYHVNDSEHAMTVLRNVQNHINASKTARIAVVTHGPGIDFLLNGVKDRNGNPYEPVVQTLKDRGVDFRVCRNTLRSRNLDDKAVLYEASVVPSGVAEIGRLQAREGYVYLKP